ncbi:MAG: NACHT domain-containing protein, partial [Verrucomicrobiaceae bacterium]
SPAFCADAAKTAFVDSLLENRIVVPVRLSEVAPNQLCGVVGTLQCFTLDQRKSIAYSKLRDADREDFAHALHLLIVDLVGKAMETGQIPPLSIPADNHGTSPEEAERALRKLVCTLSVRAGLGGQLDLQDTVRNQGCFFQMGEFPSTDPGAMASQKDVVDLLEEWAAKDYGAPFCAVLGEYGIGKTTALRRFAHQRNLRHEKDTSIPQAIFIDLREFTEEDSSSPVQRLESILSRAIELNWRAADGPRLTPEDILRAVREKGAILIFDGLDERTVHMTAQQAHEFLRELWSALPSAGQFLAQEPSRGRLVISCRSHYFRSLREMSAYFTGNHRESLSVRDYEAILVLPFGEPEIRDYLSKISGMEPERVEQTLATMRSIHNLSELAPRPVLLSFMVPLLFFPPPAGTAA